MGKGRRSLLKRLGILTEKELSEKIEDLKQDTSKKGQYELKVAQDAKKKWYQRKK